ncbi:MAG: transcription antitermination factor NusB [Acidimicrobiia bacterium]
MKRGVEARVIAATLLHRIVEEGAYSNVVVRTGTQDLERRNALFVQLLVYTAIRYLDRIDRTIDARVTREVDQIVRSILRIGVAEILFTDGERHAVVDSAVEATRAFDVPRASGFVNGVLRNVARHGEPPLPDGPSGEALRVGVPEWLYRDLVAAYGVDTATAFFEASNLPTRVGVRRRFGDAPGTPAHGINDAFILDELTGHRDAIANGDLVVSDPASTAVAAALEPQAGDRILDLAAAPGGKSLHLSDLVGGRGLIVAMDRHERKAAAAQRRTQDLGATVQWVVGDAVSPPFGEASFDRVLLDAPCTGLGTLRRRPEIRHRIDEDSAAIAGRLQRRMIEAALALVRPGGRLVYSVCTVTPDETTKVVAGTGSRAPAGLPGVALDGGLLLAPHLTGTDGMFVAVVDR